MNILNIMLEEFWALLPSMWISWLFVDSFLIAVDLTKGADPHWGRFNMHALEFLPFSPWLSQDFSFLAFLLLFLCLFLMTRIKQQEDKFRKKFMSTFDSHETRDLRNKMKEISSSPVLVSLGLGFIYLISIIGVSWGR